MDKSFIVKKYDENEAILVPEDGVLTLAVRISAIKDAHRLKMGGKVLRDEEHRYRVSE